MVLRRLPSSCYCVFLLPRCDLEVAELCFTRRLEPVSGNSSVGKWEQFGEMSILKVDTAENSVCAVIEDFEREDNCR